MNRSTTNLPEIEVAELEKLRLDLDSARQVFSRLKNRVLTGMGIAFAGWIVTVALFTADVLNQSVLPVGMAASFVVGVGYSIFGWFKTLHERPRSAVTGDELERYRVQRPGSEAKLEIAFVDRAAGTYYTIVQSAGD